MRRKRWRELRSDARFGLRILQAASLIIAPLAALALWFFSMSSSRPAFLLAGAFSCTAIFGVAAGRLAIRTSRHSEHHERSTMLDVGRSLLLGAGMSLIIALLVLWRLRT